MVRRTTTAAQRRKKAELVAVIRNVTIVVGALALAGLLYFTAKKSQRDLDPVTLCPLDPESVTLLLVDVTDPMNLPQRQDFFNELDKLVQEIPRYGKLAIVKVDPISDRLLEPVITRCNPGTAKDVSEVSGNPAKLEAMYREQFVDPLREAFEGLAVASSAPRSPILESIQSVNLTELKRSGVPEGKRRLIVASDLLQNTGDISFYKRLPEAEDLINSEAFDRTRTDLRGTDVELWMLRRNDGGRTQTRKLAETWEAIIHAQGGRLVRIYTVSG